VRRGPESIYVTDRELRLHRFDPATLSFTTVGTMKCGDEVVSNTASGTLAIDRHGNAWVGVYTQNGPTLKMMLWKIRLADASCAGVLVLAGSSISQLLYAAAYVRTNPSDPNEMLLTALRGSFFDITQALDRSLALGKVDVVTGQTAQVGTLLDPANGSGLWLNGTDDGRLFDIVLPTGSAPNTVPFEERNAMNASVTSTKPIQLGPGQPEGFALYGNSVWFFEALLDGTMRSPVEKYDTATGTVTKVVDDMGFFPVAAANSTCTPVSIL
jgi:hypothetical protein